MIVYIATGLVWAAGSVVSAADPPTRLATEMPEALQRFHREWTAGGLVVSHQITVLVDGKPKHHVQTDAKLSENLFVSVSRRLTGPSREMAQANNGEYAFVLKKGATERWLLDGLSLHTAPTPAPKFDLPTIGRLADDLRTLPAMLPLLAGAVDLTRLNDLPGYQLRSVTAGEGQRIVVNFAFDCTGGASGQLTGQAEVTVQFDPDTRWLPITWSETVRGANMTVMAATTRRATWDGRELQLTSLSDETFHTAGEPERKVTRKVELVGTPGVAIPAQDFRLPAFGLPEPPGYEPRRSRLHLWLLAGAVGAMILGTILRLAVRWGRVNS